MCIIQSFADDICIMSFFRKWIICIECYISIQWMLLTDTLGKFDIIIHQAINRHTQSSSLPYLHHNDVLQWKLYCFSLTIFIIICNLRKLGLKLPSGSSSYRTQPKCPKLNVTSKCSVALEPTRIWTCFTPTHYLTPLVIHPSPFIFMNGKFVL